MHTSQQTIRWALIIAGVIAVLITIKVAGNEAARNSPPIACQVFGGHWSLWDGWRCG